MATEQKDIVVVHDLFGTLFGLDAPTEALRQSYPSLSPLRAHSIILDWYQCFQRDLTALSINDSYQSASLVFKETLPRALKQAGLSTVPETESNDPSRIFDPADESIPGPAQAKGAQRENPYPDSVLKPIMESLQHLRPRPGFAEAFTDIYRSSSTIKGPDIQIWTATNGGPELARKLLLAAAGEQHGLDLKLRSSDSSANGKSTGVGVFSCDEVKVSKPDPKVYAALRERLGLSKTFDQSDPDPVSLWFVASHTWDLFAARGAGFKTAWVSYEEFYAVPGIYGQPDIVAGDLAEAATSILKWEQEHSSQTS
ncbi:hypothetical protein OC845_001633 [Tilletia horrida]|nr:hypothetical protein OC845_001633 [Tilletia horrida]